MTPEEAVNRHREEIGGAGPLIDRIAEGVVGRALSKTDASTIFGEPVTQGDCTVIPVGRVSTRYGFGGGAGEGTSADSGGETGTGGGGGGGGLVEVKPVGYIEVTRDDSRFVPITDGSAIAIRAITMGGLVMIVFVLGLFRAIRSRR